MLGDFRERVARLGGIELKGNVFHGGIHSRSSRNYRWRLRGGSSCIHKEVIHCVINVPRKLNYIKILIMNYEFFEDLTGCLGIDEYSRSGQRRVLLKITHPSSRLIASQSGVFEADRQNAPTSSRVRFVATTNFHPKPRVIKHAHQVPGGLIRLEST